MSSIRESSRAAFAAIAILGASASARAQDSGNGAMAETLFKDAKDLMARGDYAAACPKLAESNRLDPGTGTLTALALCHEAQGKTASAWAEFIEVQGAAQRAQRPDREALARQHIAQLEPQLPHLTIRVDAKATDLKVFRDDVVVGNAAWASPLAVDPGEHVVRAQAPGYRPFSIQVTLAQSESKSVVVPALEELPKEVTLTPVTPDTTPHDTAHPGNGQRIAAVAIGGVGLVALGFGTFFGVQAISNANTANSLCPAACTNPSAVQTNNDAKSDALAADVLIGVGAVALVTAVIVYLVAPRATTVTAGLRGASLRIAF